MSDFLGFDLNKPTSRRDFLRRAGKAAKIAAGFAVPPLLSEVGLDKDRQVKNLEEEYLEKRKKAYGTEEGVEYVRVNIEKTKYPEKQDAPEFLQKYVEECGSWKKLIENQKSLVKDFLQSEKYKDTLRKHFIDYFGGGQKQEMINMLNTHIDRLIFNSPENREVYRREEITKCEKLFPSSEADLDGYISEQLPILIADRIANIEKLKEVFCTLPKGTLGEYDIDEGLASYDTLQSDVSDKEKRQAQKNEKPLPTARLTVPAHESMHASQFPDLLFIGTMVRVLHSVLNKKFADRLYTKTCTIYSEFKGFEKTENGRITNITSENIQYNLIPYEVVSFLMEIRTALHLVSKYHPDKCKFDMTKDDFTKEHFNFLKENQSKILSEKYLGGKRSNLFSDFVELLGEEEFIYLMNNAI